MTGIRPGQIKLGPDAITRTGPPSLRDARELFGCFQPDTAKKGENAVYAKAYARFEQNRS